MFFFGHLGLSVGAGQLINRDRLDGENKIDLRWAGLMSLAPDLVDKPVGLSAARFFRYNTRLFAHNLFLPSLVFFLLFAVFPWKRKTKFTLCAFYFGHLALDRMWSLSREVFLYPFAGEVPWLEPGALKRWWGVLREPYTLGGEIAGFSVLVYLILRHRLFRKENFARFLRTGAI